MKKLLSILGLFLSLTLNGLGVGSNSVTLAWDHSLDASVSGYNIYYGGSTRNYTNRVSTGYTNITTIYGLPNGTYYFTATAFNSAGLESDYSNEVGWTPIVSPEFVVSLFDTNSVVTNGQPITVFYLSSINAITNTLVNYILSGTAIYGTDYTINTNIPVQFLAGSNKVTQTITTIKNTVASTNNKTLLVTLTNGLGYTIGSPNSRAFLLIPATVQSTNTLPSEVKDFRILEVK